MKKRKLDDITYALVLWLLAEQCAQREWAAMERRVKRAEAKR